MFLCLAGSRGLMTVITRARENPAENFRELCLGLSERWKLHLPIVLGEVFTTGFPRSAIVPKGNGREREQRVKVVSSAVRPDSKKNSAVATSKTLTFKFLSPRRPFRIVVRRGDQLGANF